MKQQDYKLNALLIIIVMLFANLSGFALQSDSEIEPVIKTSAGRFVQKQEDSRLDNKGVMIKLDEVKKRFGRTFVTNAYVAVRSLTEGTINRFSNDPDNETNLGIFLEIKVNDNGLEYYLIYLLLSELEPIFSKKTTVKKDEIIGRTGPSGPLVQFDNDSSLMISMYTFEENPAVEELSNSVPHKQNGVFWYSPYFLFDQEHKKREENDFDTSSYKRITSQEFLELFYGEPGYILYGFRKYWMGIEVQNFPVPVNEQDKKNISAAHSIADIDEIPEVEYSHKMTVNYTTIENSDKVYTLNLYIQSPLVPFVDIEYELGDTMNINFIMSYIDNLNLEVSLLVSAIGVE